MKIDNTENDHIHHHSLEEVFSEPTNTEEKDSLWAAFIEVVIYIVVILTLVVVIRYFFISPFSVDGQSMEPNLHHEELIIVNKIGYQQFLDYKVGEPERGDIIVLIPPQNTSKFYVKRIIGLPSEKVEFVNGEVIIKNEEYPQGVRLNEEYLKKQDNHHTNPPGGFRNRSISLGDREYYVLGDNRSHSSDSRSFGAVNRANIVGKVWLVAWPFEKFRIIEHYLYSLFSKFLIN